MESFKTSLAIWGFAAFSHAQAQQLSIDLPSVNEFVQKRFTEKIEADQPNSIDEALVIQEENRFKEQVEQIIFQQHDVGAVRNLKTKNSKKNQSKNSSGSSDQDSDDLPWWAKAQRNSDRSSNSKSKKKKGSDSSSDEDDSENLQANESKKSNKGNAYGKSKKNSKCGKGKKKSDCSSEDGNLNEQDQQQSRSKQGSFSRGNDGSKLNESKNNGNNGKKKSTKSTKGKKTKKSRSTKTDKCLDSRYHSQCEYEEGDPRLDQKSKRSGSNSDSESEASSCMSGMLGCECVGENCPCVGEDCPTVPCEGEECPCEGEECPCEGLECPCEGEECPCEGEDCAPPPQCDGMIEEYQQLLTDGNAQVESGLVKVNNQCAAFVDYFGQSPLFDSTNPTPTSVPTIEEMFEIIMLAKDEDPDFQKTYFIKVPTVSEIPPGCGQISDEYVVEVESLIAQMEDNVDFAAYALDPMYPVFGSLDTWMTCKNDYFADYCP